MTLLGLIAVGWLVLGVVNLVKDRIGIGVVYILIGIGCGAFWARLSRGSGTH